MIEAADADHERIRCVCDPALPRFTDMQLWSHPIANVAARDRHGLTGEQPDLPNAEPQRYLVVSEPLVEPACRVLARLPVFEPRYPVSTLPTDKLTGILAERYATMTGIFGAHRCFHATAETCAIETLKRLVVTTIQ